jgi:hypothetical protein
MIKHSTSVMTQQKMAAKILNDADLVLVSACNIERTGQYAPEEM